MGRAIVSMLRIWLVRISPVIGRPGGRTTLVGNGRTRDVMGQTMAKAAGRPVPCPWSGRSRSRSNRRGRVRRPAPSLLDDLTANIRSPVEGPGVSRPPLPRTPACEKPLQGEMRHSATDDDFPVVGFDLHTLAIAQPRSLHDRAREPDS